MSEYLHSHKDVLERCATICHITIKKCGRTWAPVEKERWLVFFKIPGVISTGILNDRTGSVSVSNDSSPRPPSSKIPSTNYQLRVSWTCLSHRIYLLYHKSEGAPLKFHRTALHFISYYYETLQKCRTTLLKADRMGKKWQTWSQQCKTKNITDLLLGLALLLHLEPEKHCVFLPEFDRQNVQHPRLELEKRFQRAYHPQAPRSLSAEIKADYWVTLAIALKSHDDKSEQTGSFPNPDTFSNSVVISIISGVQCPSKYKSQNLHREL